MGLTKMTADVENISKLADMPNSDNNITAEQLKDKFDKGNVDIKDYINNTLTTEIDDTLATKEEIQDLVAGTVIDGSITKEKLNSSLRAKLDNVYDVDNVVTKALLYPELVSLEDMELAKENPNYKGSKIQAILNAINDLTKVYTEMKYESVITGNSTKGYIQKSNISFSSLPKIKNQYGEGYASLSGNCLKIQVDEEEYVDMEIEFPYDGCQFNMIGLWGTHGDRPATGEFRMSYSSDKGKSWTSVTGDDGVGSHYSGNTLINVKEGYYYQDYSDDIQKINLGNGNTKITNLKFFVSDRVSKRNNGYFYGKKFTIFPIYNITDSKVKSDLGITSATGMFAGGTGSMNIEDSGVLTLNQNLTSGNVSILLDTNATWETEDYRSTQIKTAYFQGSTNGSSWNDLYTITASCENKYGDVDPHMHCISLPTGYKYFRVYTPQNQTATKVPCTNMIFEGFVYSKADNVEFETEIAVNSIALTKAYYRMLGSRRLNWTVKAIVDPSNTAVEHTLTENGINTLTNSNSSKDIKFKLTANNLIGSETITSFLGGYI